MFRKIVCKLAKFAERLTKSLRMPASDIESDTQAISRRVLAVLLAATAGLAGSFPGIHPNCALATQREIARLAKALWDNPPPIGELA